MLQLKKHYEAVVDLKNASGFTYSDKDGARITLVQTNVWKRYIKVSIKHTRILKMVWLSS